MLLPYQKRAYALAVGISVLIVIVAVWALVSSCRSSGNPSREEKRSAALSPEEKAIKDAVLSQDPSATFERWGPHDLNRTFPSGFGAVTMSRLRVVFVIGGERVDSIFAVVKHDGKLLVRSSASNEHGDKWLEKNSGDKATQPQRKRGKLVWDGTKAVEVP